MEKRDPGFRKQADRSFFPSSTMPAPYTGRSSAAPMAWPATEKQIAEQKAWVEGFGEGLKGALKGDGFRGLIRGGLHESADITDWLGEAPYKAPFIPAMLLAKALKWTTGNKAYEEAVRDARKSVVNTGALTTHALTNGMRRIADIKALDPKYLTQDAYNQSVLAGRAGVIAADMAVGSKIDTALKLGSWLKLFRHANKTPNMARAMRAARTVRKLNKAYNRILLAEGLAEIGGAVASGVEDDVEATIDQINSQQQSPPGAPTIKDNRAASAPYLAAMLGATAGLGTYGVTSLIPKLKNKKALRLLLAGLAAIPGAYAGYKVVQPIQK